MIFAHLLHWIAPLLIADDGDSNGYAVLGIPLVAISAAALLFAWLWARQEGLLKQQKDMTEQAWTVVKAERDNNKNLIDTITAIQAKALTEIKTERDKNDILHDKLTDAVKEVATHRANACDLVPTCLQRTPLKHDH